MSLSTRYVVSYFLRAHFFLYIFLACCQVVLFLRLERWEIKYENHPVNFNETPNHFTIIFHTV